MSVSSHSSGTPLFRSLWEPASHHRITDGQSIIIHATWWTDLFMYIWTMDYLPILHLKMNCQDHHCSLWDLASHHKITNGQSIIIHAELTCSCTYRLSFTSSAELSSGHWDSSEESLLDLCLLGGFKLEICQLLLPCPEMYIELRTPICFYYRLIRLAPISIYKLSTSCLQAPCSNRYRLAHQMLARNGPNLVPDLDNPNQLFETQFGDNMKFQPFQRINGSAQFGNLSGK